MSLTGIKSKPLLRGTLASVGPWQALLAREGLRIYPYQLGCMVRTTASASPILTHGLGEFAQNNYILPCAATSYGNSTLFIPQIARLTRVTSDPSAAADDTLSVAPGVSVTAGDWLFNLGNDGASSPLIAPNYDGSTLTLYSDPAGNNAISPKYIRSGTGGFFRCWMGSGTIRADLLITDSSGVPLVVIPGVDVGPEVI